MSTSGSGDSRQPGRARRLLSILRSSAAVESVFQTCANGVSDNKSEHCSSLKYTARASATQYTRSADMPQMQFAVLMQLMNPMDEPIKLST